MSSTIKSPWIIHYDASSCNGCDIEVLACLTPMYDVERFGIINTGNPKHADIFLVTGSVNERNITVVQQIYEQMIEPKVVIACGICACSGGIFKECYNTLGGIDVAIPVDVYAPGCAVRPEALIDAVVTGLGILEEKRAAFDAGTLVAPTLPVCLTAADKLVDGQTVRAQALADTKAGAGADVTATARVAAAATVDPQSKP
ncbi:MAG: NADH-quinone oxidoreductase subunit NuoB [Coriobacteriales bacterium]|jgi:ech hydrogenase subunit C|nr:NADH-quinone oxidoreductase subunit NuoB [Coriobacteriales bacterium]